MKRIEIRNYLSFENICLDFNELNVFIGENNSGKTSLMKFVNHIGKNNSLIFENSKLSEQLFKNIVGNEKQEIDVFYSFNQFGEKGDDMFHPLFEMIKIGTTKKYLRPLILELVTFNDDGQLVKFAIKYNEGEMDSEEIKIKSISIYEKSSRNLNIENFDNVEKNLYLDLIFDEFKNEKPVNEILFEGNDELQKILLKEKKHKLSVGELKENINASLKLRLNYATKGVRLEIQNLYSLYLINKVDITGNDKELLISIFINNKRFYNSFNNFKYVKPLRKTFEQFYVEDHYNDINLEEKDECLYVLKKMNNNILLKEKIVNFFSDISNFSDISLKSRFIKEMGIKVYMPEYKLANSNEEYNLTFSGTGISQVLPIVYYFSLMENSGRIMSLCVEQPEVHLHAKAQVELGRLIFNSISNVRNRLENENIFIETHSNFILDAFRSLSKNNNSFSTTNKIKIFFFEKENNRTVIDEICIRNGKFSGKYERYLKFLQDHSMKMLGI
jgi:predicted ATPase